MDNLNFSKEFNIFYKEVISLTGNLVIYGNGTVGKTIQSLITDKIIGYVDINDKNNHPEKLRNMKFDKVVISVLGREKEILRYLVENIGIDEKKIITFNISDILTKKDEDNNSEYNKTVKHHYKNFSILLPNYSVIPKYQKQFQKYDKFLPHLASYVKNNEYIIDIGANVGDSLASMIEQNSDCSYLCIEADEYFFNLLCENIEIIKNKINTSKIFLNNSFVGKNITNISLKGDNGTKHAVVNSDGKIQAKSLDQIILMYPEINNIRLLKSDVDGFDYDVIDSSIEIIKKYKPLLFFECQYDFKWQLNGYIELLSTLNSLGYNRYIILDNFGDIMLKTSDMKIIKQLLRYIERQNIKESTRTIYYLDILAVNKYDTLDIDDVISRFLEYNKPFYND